MKITTEFLIEIVMIFATAYENYDVYLIMDFSALIVVNYIDIYYYQTVKDDLKSEVEDSKYCMPVIKKRVNLNSLSKTQKFQFILIKMCF